MNDLKWDAHYDKVVKFIQQHGRYPTDTRKDKGEEVPLAKWLYHQRYLIRLNKFPEERLEKFNKINPTTSFFNKKWQNNLKQVIQFTKKNNRLPFWDSLEEKHLRLWYHNQYTFYRKGTLNQQRKTLLDASGILKYIYENDVWKKRYDEFLKYVTQHKRPPKTGAHGYEKKLAHWYALNKSALKRGTLSSERALQMKELIQVSPKREGRVEAIWTKHFNKLLIFKKQYGRLPKSTAKDRDELRLYYWLSDQKKYYRQNKLSAEQIGRLRLFSSETLNIKEFSVKHQDKQIERWHINYKNVKNFLKQHGRFPFTYNNTIQEIRLGNWCRYQKRKYHDRTLNGERYKLLEEIGFNFS